MQLVKMLHPLLRALSVCDRVDQLRNAFELGLFLA
jgi:hypothetical protein